jgi:hypothetical protein
MGDALKQVDGRNSGFSTAYLAVSREICAAAEVLHGEYIWHVRKGVPFR